MRALNVRLLVGVVLAQFLAIGCISCTQASRSLQDRIPKPDVRKYASVRDAKGWRNPYLVVRPEGIEIIGMTPVGKAISVDSIPGNLEGLPDSAWPYGLVVAVQDTGILSGKTDAANIEANRTRLLNLLDKLGIAVDRWPSA